MRDKKLIGLAMLATIFLTAHFVDHIFRGDLKFPPGAESLPFILVSLALYAIIGIGLLLYWKSRIGPRF